MVLNVRKNFNESKINCKTDSLKLKLIHITPLINNLKDHALHDSNRKNKFITHL